MISRTLVLSPSWRPLDRPRVIAASMPSRCLRIVRAALTNPGMRLRCARELQQFVDGGGVEVAGEHRAQGFLELVGPPQDPAGAFDLGQCLGLVACEGVGVLQQRLTWVT
jgi:hypothetical protein